MDFSLQTCGCVCLTQFFSCRSSIFLSLVRMNGLSRFVFRQFTKTLFFACVGVIERYMHVSIQPYGHVRVPEYGFFLKKIKLIQIRAGVDNGDDGDDSDADGDDGDDGDADGDDDVDDAAADNDADDDEGGKFGRHATGAAILWQSCARVTHFLATCGHAMVDSTSAEWTPHCFRYNASTLFSGEKKTLLTSSCATRGELSAANIGQATVFDVILNTIQTATQENAAVWKESVTALHETFAIPAELQAQVNAVTVAKFGYHSACPATLIFCKDDLRPLAKGDFVQTGTSFLAVAKTTALKLGAFVEHFFVVYMCELLLTDATNAQLLFAAFGNVSKPKLNAILFDDSFAPFRLQNGVAEHTDNVIDKFIKPHMVCSQYSTGSVGFVHDLCGNMHTQLTFAKGNVDYSAVLTSSGNLKHNDAWRYILEQLSSLPVLQVEPAPATNLQFEKIVWKQMYTFMDLATGEFAISLAQKRKLFGAANVVTVTGVGELADVNMRKSMLSKLFNRGLVQYAFENAKNVTSFITDGHVLHLKTCRKVPIKEQWVGADVPLEDKLAFLENVPLQQWGNVVFHKLDGREIDFELADSIGRAILSKVGVNPNKAGVTNEKHIGKLFADSDYCFASASDFDRHCWLLRQVMNKTGVFSNLAIDPGKNQVCMCI